MTTWELLPKAEIDEIIKRAKVARRHSALQDKDEEEESFKKKNTRTEIDRVARRRQNELYERLLARGVARVPLMEMTEWNEEWTDKQILRDLGVLRREGRVSFTSERGKGMYWARP